MTVYPSSLDVFAVEVNDSVLHLYFTNAYGEFYKFALAKNEQAVKVGCLVRPKLRGADFSDVFSVIWPSQQTLKKLHGDCVVLACHTTQCWEGTDMILSGKTSDYSETLLESWW